MLSGITLPSLTQKVQTPFPFCSFLFLFYLMPARIQLAGLHDSRLHHLYVIFKT